MVFLRPQGGLMRLKTWTLCFFAAIILLLPIYTKVTAAEISAAIDVAEEPETAYYTLVDPERYTLISEASLVNKGLESAYNVSIRMALMDNDTPLYSNRLREQLIPWPDSISTDEYGRRVAHYHIDELAPGQKLLFTQKYVLECGGIKYPGIGAVSQAGYEEQMAAQYLLPSTGIESDNEEIITFAREVAGNERDAYAMAKAAFAAVNKYMTYAPEDTEPITWGALRALHRAQGVCEDFSKLYVAVLRALGIAARQQSGYLYLPMEHDEPPYVDEVGRLNLNLLRHAWAEFYLPGKGWITADPTFIYSFEVGGVITKYIDWDYFAQITKERRYIFFREESLNEDSTLKFNIGSRNNHRVEGSINCYLLPGSQAAYFNDLEGHWAEEAIMRLAERDEPLLQGLGNGMFGVNEPMTRAQLVTCLQRLMKSPPAGTKFTDLSTSHWAYRDIGSAQQAGWISGYPDGTFRADNPVSRAELAQLLVSVFELAEPESDPDSMEEISGEETPAGDFEDILVEESPDMEDGELTGEETTDPEDGENSDEESEGIDEDALPLAALPRQVFSDLGQPGYTWADKPITILFKLGFTQGNGQGYYQPERPVTRAEFATFLDRIISAQEQAREKAQERIEGDDGQQHKKDY